MKRLIENSGLNTAEDYDAIYTVRSEKGFVDTFDYERWKVLLARYKGGSLIDLGCLDSLVPVLAKIMYPEAYVVGVDQSSVAITDMRKKYPEPRFEIRDVYETDYPDEYFDYAVAGEILEHLERPHDFIKESFRILKPGGTLALSTPLEEHKEPGAVDMDRHIWSFSKDDIGEMLSPYGKVKTRVLRSRLFPKYQYRWPVIIAYVKKR